MSLACRTFVPVTLTLIAALPAGAQELSALEEVTVTAQRRDENLQKSPVSIIAVDAEAAERRQIFDAKQIIFNVPNLTGNSNPGQSAGTMFFIRGVGVTDNLATTDPAVGLYVDDVYFSGKGVNNFSLADIERIEVLRGPQGALYGRNTNGGAIKIVTRKPGADPELSLRVSAGNEGRRELKASGNLPLSDVLFLRATALLQEGDGLSYNETLGKDVNDLDYRGARIALRYAPGESFVADFAYDYGKDETNGTYGSDIAGVLRPSRGDYFRTISNVDASNLGRTQGGNLTLSWSLANDRTLSSITGFRSTLQDLNIDLSDQNPSRYQLLQRQDNDQISEELQLAGALSDSLRFVSGLYYFKEDTDVAVTDRIAPNFFSKTFTVDSTSEAAFGQLEYSIGPFTLIGGLRYTRDEKELRVSQTGNQAGLFVYDTATLIARGAAGQNISPDRRFSQLTPKAGLNWEVNDDLFAYLSYTSGYRSGGWTGRATRADQYVNFNPEEVESYEIGAKATLLDGRLRWNNTLFRMDYTNLFNTLNIAGVFTVQTADATIQGLESEFTLRATSWLDVFINLGLLDSKYTGARPANLAPDLQRAPELQGKAGFSIQYPLAAGTLLVNGDVYHTKEYAVTPANLAFTAPLLPRSVTPSGAYSLVNASVGYRWAEGRLEVGLSCTNCLDETFFEAANYIGSYAAVYPGAPRLYRADFSYKLFGNAN